MLMDWLLAAAPVALVLVLMVGFRWSAARAGAAGWLTALGVAGARFGAGWQLLALAQGKSLLLSLYVLYIIWMALLFYHVVNSAGAIKAIGAGLPSLTKDRGMQALLLGWAFGAFLQGVSGYGVPTAVVAPLLVGLGFGPAAAVVIAGIGHAWAVTFGSLAASFQALIAATGRSGPELAPMSALLLGVACFGCGMAVLWAAGGMGTVARNAIPFVVLGLVMSGVQYVIALQGLYTLAAMGAGLAGMGTAVVLARWGNSGRDRDDPPAAVSAAPSTLEVRTLSLWLALAPYALLVVIVGVAQLVEPVGQALDVWVIRIRFPEMRTALGYVTPAETGRTISVFGHAGALLAYTAILTFALFARLRRYETEAYGAARLIWRATVKGALPSSLGIATMVAMAVTMEHAGMTRLLAEGLSLAAGKAFPVVAPLIGALGAFMTGSNTNSNVVFASLQENVAQLLSLSPALILAAQTTGGALGGAFAPAKVIVGCSTVGLAGQEGGVLKATLLYGMAILVVVGLVTFALAVW
jgi:lactate permease